MSDNVALQGSQVSSRRPAQAQPTPADDLADDLCAIAVDTLADYWYPSSEGRLIRLQEQLHRRIARRLRAEPR